MQASKHFHKFQEVSSKRNFVRHCCKELSVQWWMQKYASAYNHKLPNASPVSQSQARSLSPAVPCNKRARYAPQSSAAPATVAKAAISSESDRSETSHKKVAVNKQRKARYETSAALADPLGAFAHQAGHKQRTLLSGLTLLKGKASQARLASSNLRSPRGRPAAQLDSQELIPGNSFAQYANDSRKHQVSVQPRERLTKKTRPRPQVAKEASQKQTPPSASPAGSQDAALADAQAAPFGQSQHSPPQESAQATPQRVDINYFHHIKSSLHNLIQANHAIPSLHIMSQPDREALTSILAHKLDGVDVTAEVQTHFLPNQQQKVAPKPQAFAQPAHEHPGAEQQPSAVSSVDCTPSPESVVQQQSSARRKQASKPLLRSQHIPYGTFASTCVSNALHPSAASSGSGQRHFTHQHTHHSAKSHEQESFLNLLELYQDVGDDLQHSLWQGRNECNAGDFALLSEADQDVLTFKESPKIDWYVPTITTSDCTWQAHSLMVLRLEHADCTVYEPHSCITHDRQIWHHGPRHARKLFVRLLTMLKSLPSFFRSSSTRTATEHMPSRSCHSQAWDMQDCFAQFAEEENTDLFAQSPEHQRAPFADAVDGPSAEDALFGKFQQGESAWSSTCYGVPSALDKVTDSPERSNLICPLGCTDLQSLLKCMHHTGIV